MDEPAGAGTESLGNLNLRAAAAFLRGLVDGGVRRAVLSPGSRSSPLALAADLCPHLETTILPDERCAAFLALGLARGGGRPVAVIGTSGTAPANWYPAVIEASMDLVPMVLVSADRPAELLRTGANQTVDQARMFAGYPRDFHPLPAPRGPDLRLYLSTGRRAVDAAIWPRPGPVHVNFAFREPLMPDAGAEDLEWPTPLSDTPQRPMVRPDPATLDRLVERLAGGNGLIVCGRSRFPMDFAPAVVRLAESLDCPLIADPLSNLRWGAHDRTRILTAADILLRRDPGGPRADWILQFGATPTSRAVQQWIANQGDALLPVVETADWPDPGRGSALALHADPLALVGELMSRHIDPVDEDWNRTWHELDRAALGLLQEPSCRPPEADLIEAIETGIAEGAALFVGSSMPIRSLDAFGRGRTASLTAFGNRGASGIDGSVSTLAGLGRCRPAVGLIGDLALYHDMNGLLACRETPGKLVVMDNGGGGIFGLLPQRDDRRFERLWRTPTGLSCKDAARLYRLRHSVAYTPESLATILADPDEDRGMQLIEVPVDAELSWDRYRALAEAAKAL